MKPLSPRSLALKAFSVAKSWRFPRVGKVEKWGGNFMQEITSAIFWGVFFLLPCLTPQNTIDMGSPKKHKKIERETHSEPNLHDF